MPFDGSGNFTRNYNWVTDRNNGEKIQAARMDGEFDNYATALNLVLLRDGRAPMSGDLAMGGNRLKGVNAGSLASCSLQFTAGVNTGLFMPVVGELGLVASGTERLRLNASGGAITGGLSVTGAITATGGQIQFPATQNPSANPNTLDDYEEGTFTPTLKFGGASVGITYGAIGGWYHKVGRGVKWGMLSILTSKGVSVGAASVLLPFTIGTDSDCTFKMNVNTNGAASMTNPAAWSNATNTAAFLYNQGAGAMTSYTDADFTNTTYFRVGGSYLADN